MNYSEMTDFEINKRVAELIGGFIEEDIFEKEQTIFRHHVSGKYSHFDPCTSWADAGPIIERHMICLAADVFAETQDGGKWVAQPAYGWDSERVRSDNPLRAAMIVFLMMKEKPDAA